MDSGISIPDGADLSSDTYKIPGNYYCSNNDRVKTLKYGPVGIEEAFTLKVELSNGTMYPRQTYKTFTNTKIWVRTWDSFENRWGSFKELLTSLNGFLSYGGIELTGDMDLDNYSTCGTYYCTGDDTARKIQNCPSWTAFIMYISLATGVGHPSQTIREYASGTIYYRVKMWYNGSYGWRPWMQIKTTEV